MEPAKRACGTRGLSLLGVAGLLLWAAGAGRAQTSSKGNVGAKRAQSPPAASTTPIAGPLTASGNPNYFRDASGAVLILSGSQTWNTLQDWGSNGSPLNFGLGNGSLGRNTYRAPGFYNTDFSLSKHIKFNEVREFILRADFLNAFNQDNYGIPVNSLNSADFGKNLNNFGNRSITLGAKFRF